MDKYNFDNTETYMAWQWIQSDTPMRQTVHHIANTKGRQDSFRPPLDNYERSKVLKDYLYTLCMGEDAEINGKAHGLVCDLVNNALHTINYMQLIEANKEGEPVK